LDRTAESTICSRTGVRGGLLAAAVSATVVSLALFTKIEVFSWLTFTATVLFCSLGFSKRKSTFTNALFRKSLLVSVSAIDYGYSKLSDTLPFSTIRLGLLPLFFSYS
jgi:prepilin signal peptidase PulO-like enzyme (type II secretory pathway)